MVIKIKEHYYRLQDRILMMGFSLLPSSI